MFATTSTVKKKKKNIHGYIYVVVWFIFTLYYKQANSIKVEVVRAEK